MTPVTGEGAELAAVLKRVSTDLTRQEIGNQDADVARVTSEGSFNVQRTFELEASAFKGEHAPALAEILADVQAGRYTVVIAAMTSRFERRGWKVLMRWMLDLDAAGGRLIAADNPNFGDLSTPMGGMLTIMTGDADHSYSDSISKNVNRANRKRDAEGSFRGSVPAGYMVTGVKGAKRLVPDVIGEGTRGYPAEVIATAITDAGNGASTVTLGARLGMTTSAVGKLLRNSMYSTGRYVIDRNDGVTVQHQTTPLVTPDVQRNAIAGLEARDTSTRALRESHRGETTEQDFSGAVWCPVCENPKPMYRYNGGGKPKADGTPTPRTRRYGCKKIVGGCGKSVDADNCDREIDALMSGRLGPWIVTRWIDGDDHAAELARVKLELKEVGARGLADDEEDALKAELRAERDRLAELAAHTEPGHWEARPSGKSEGDRWAELNNAAERRAWLTSGEFMIYARATGDRSGNVLVNLEYVADDQGET